jgi:hypothetical protein
VGLSQGAPEKRPVLSKVEARQGVTGHNVRYVLWFGLAAVIVAFAAIHFSILIKATRYARKMKTRGVGAAFDAGEVSRVFRTFGLAERRPILAQRGA